MKISTCASHERSIQYSVTEVLETKTSIDPQIMNRISEFEQNCAYHFRSGESILRWNNSKVPKSGSTFQRVMF